MVELVSGPDSALCADSKYCAPYSGNDYWSLTYRLCSYDFRRFPVDFGYLTQGNSIPELNWKECYNAKADGSICKRSTIPLHPSNTKGDIFFGTDELLTPDGTDWHVFPSKVFVPVNKGHYLIEFSRRTKTKAAVYFWKTDERGAGYFGWRVWATTVQRFGSQYRVLSTGVRGSFETLPEAGLPFPADKPEDVSGIDWFEKKPTQQEEEQVFMSAIENVLIPSLQRWIEDGVSLYAHVVPDLNLRYSLLVSDLYGKLSPRRVRDYLNHYSHQLITDTNQAVATHLQEIEATAFDAIQKFDGNFYVFLSKLGILGSTTLKSVIDLGNAESIHQGLAGFWLANRFGDRLQLKSTVDLVNAIFDNILDANQPPKYIQGRARSRLQLDELWNTTVACNCMLALTPKDYNGIMSAIRHAYEWDYFPTLANVWDAVPLSFVVNWFVDISSIFQDIDRMAQSRYYDVKCIMISKKVEAVCPVLPGVTLSYYSREFERSLNLGVSGVSFGLPSAINIVDGISLIASSV